MHGRAGINLQTKWQPPGLKTEVNAKVPKTAVALEGGSKSQSVLINGNVKTNFTAEVNIFTAWYKKWF